MARQLQAAVKQALCGDSCNERWVTLESTTIKSPHRRQNMPCLPLDPVFSS